MSRVGPVVGSAAATAATAAAAAKNPFDEGWRKNCRRVFGDVPWYTHLLPNFTPPAAPMYPFEYEEGEDRWRASASAYAAGATGAAGTGGTHTQFVTIV
jgi:hypothetical protein